VAAAVELFSVQCPNCGADLPPSRPCGSYLCAYCGSRFEVGAVRAAKDAQGQPVAVERLTQDLRPAIAVTAIGLVIAAVIMLIVVGGIVMTVVFVAREVENAQVAFDPANTPPANNTPSVPSSAGQEKDVDPPPPEASPERLSISTPSKEIPGFFVEGDEALVVLRMRRHRPVESLLVEARRIVDGERVWRFDTEATWDGRQATSYAVEGARVLVSDHRAQVHVLDGRTGEVLRTHTLTDQVAGFCRADGALFVRSADLKAWRFDDSRDDFVSHDARALRNNCSGLRNATDPVPDHVFAWEVRLRRPKRERIEGSDTRWLRRFEHRETGRLWDHEAAWLFGQRHPGTPVPRVARIDPKTEQIDWITDVPEGTHLEVGTDRGGAVSDGERIYVMYPGRGRDWHLAAIDGDEGARLWSRTLPDPISFLGFEVLAVLEGTVVLVAERRLTAYDAATGAERWTSGG
jgi:outer membrane protein assembly factor BamB